MSPKPPSSTSVTFHASAPPSPPQPLKHSSTPSFHPDSTTAIASSMVFPPSPSRNCNMSKTLLPDYSPVPDPDNTSHPSSVNFAGSPYNSVFNSRSSSPPIKPCTTSPPHTSLTSSFATPLPAASAPLTTTSSPPSPRPNTVPWGTEPLPSPPQPSGTPCHSPSATVTHFHHLKPT